MLSSLRPLCAAIALAMAAAGTAQDRLCLSATVEFEDPVTAEALDP
jgi:hypothetical protein